LPCAKKVGCFGANFVGRSQFHWLPPISWDKQPMKLALICEPTSLAPMPFSGLLPTSLVAVEFNGDLPLLPQYRHQLTWQKLMLELHL
jgi:hypothetical protein